MSCLATHLHWLLAHPPELATLRARTAGLAQDSRQQIGRLAVALAVAERWPRDEYRRLARSLDLMPEGALEVINDWSFDRFDEASLEDDDPILVNLALLSSPQAGPAPRRNLPHTQPAITG